MIASSLRHTAGLRAAALQAGLGTLPPALEERNEGEPRVHPPALSTLALGCCCSRGYLGTSEFGLLFLQL